MHKNIDLAIISEYCNIIQNQVALKRLNFLILKQITKSVTSGKIN